jgi:hypothetical protein
MPNQTILFTVMPRGMSLNTQTLPVSVFVSPRLYGASQLSSFPDWLKWTAQLKEKGLRLTLRCDGHTRDFEIDTKVLRPDLWEAMFKETTFVRSHTFTDYSDRAIFSYPARLALSAIKSIYQQAGVVLGLPDRRPFPQDEKRYSPNREFIKGLLAGLEVNWNADKGEGLRDAYRSGFGQLSTLATVQPVHQNPAFLEADGTLNNMPPAGTPQAKTVNQFLANQFAVYTHMPQGASVADNPPDFDNLIDFHQALSSLSSYPDLLRALGLVFDLELPRNFVAATPINVPAHMAVVDLPGHTWAIPTQTPPSLDPLETAYLYFTLGSPPNTWSIFTTAPGLLGGGYADLEVFGLLNLNPTRYGLAQVDLESGMFKNILLAESWQDDRPGLAPSDHPEVFDETTTLPSLRSGGFSLFADGRALRLLRTFQENQGFNTDLENSDPPARPFFAEDLVHGLRLDVWDSHTDEWHSLHQRSGTYKIEQRTFKTQKEEGFAQLAAGQAAPDPDNPTPDDLYLNESVARWAGWSLSAPFPGKSLSRDPDPDKALDEDSNHPANEPATPFKMTTEFSVIPSSLPALRFGRRYRLRARPVDICGNSMAADDPLAALLALLAGLPRDPEGFPYLRYEPVAAPSVVPRDTTALTGPGSQLERLVMRTFNDDPSKDGDPADLSASDRFIVPPSTSVEVGERLGMFDDPNGKLDTSPGMYHLISERDAGRFPHVTVEVAGQMQEFPLVSDESIEALPYLPDALARGASLRDLPGSPDGSLAKVAPGAGTSEALPYQILAQANSHPGSAALIGFGGGGDWQKLQPFRLALADGEGTPTWDPQKRLLTVPLPKGTQALVPLSSYLSSEDLKLMGVWQWLREYIDKITAQQPDVPVLDLDLDVEKIAQLLQRALEGGHWMITPPRLLTLAHAVQQPVGRPEFSAISAQHEPYGTPDGWGGYDEKLDPDPNVLQTTPESTPTAENELDRLTGWRKPRAREAFLLGGLKIHAASTGKIDLLAEWSDPYDDTAQPREEGQEYRQANSAQVDEIPIPGTQEGYITTGQGGPNYRQLAYYDADHDLLCFARSGDQLGNLPSGVTIYGDTAPRHHFNDTRYHQVRYTARATSRFREYFAQDQHLDFTRSSEVVVVDVPASARPAAPRVDYVVPTFGWQRQTESNLKRSVRFGGGLRVYLERPWFSSGDGELLGVALYDYINGALSDREEWKRFVTQWGADPIWKAPGLSMLPAPYHFPNAGAQEYNLSLPGKAPGRVAVAGFPVTFDFATQKWFADLTIDFGSLAYTPFIRLALVRYQPHALPDAKLSAAVLADFAQLTPERSALLTADPYHPRRLRLTVSGPAPQGPPPVISGEPQPSEPVNVPTQVVVSLQQRNPAVGGDLGWQEAPTGAATITAQSSGVLGGLLRWSGTVDFAQVPESDQYRLLVREYEYLPASYTEASGSGRGQPVRHEQPKRLIYAEAFEVDAALVGGPGRGMGTVVEG